MYITYLLTFVFTKNIHVCVSTCRKHKKLFKILQGTDYPKLGCANLCWPCALNDGAINRVFRKLTTLTIMTILASEALLREKKSSDKMLPAVGLEPRQPLILSPTLSSPH